MRKPNKEEQAKLDKINEELHIGLVKSKKALHESFKINMEFLNNEYE